jgi:16S rRNA (guanine527-N7)-methyltransferase
MAPRPRPTPPGPRPAPPEREPLPTDASGLDALPDVFHDTLRAGLAELALELAPAQLDGLDAFVRLLLRWTQAINLTAIREPEAVARDHLLDSLSAVPLLREWGVERILDLGSGGGLPGIPLAIAFPESHVLLVESVGKKAGFLRTAVAADVAGGMRGRVAVAAARAEDLAVPERGRAQWDVVTVRAVASLAELIELSFPLLRVGGRLVAWKREPMDAEVATARNAARALGGEIDVHEVPIEQFADRRLVVVEKTRATPRRYPRPPAERRSHPL